MIHSSTRKRSRNRRHQIEAPGSHVASGRAPVAVVHGNGENERGLTERGKSEKAVGEDGLFKPVQQTPRYKLVARQIADLILSGKLESGSKMPAERELVDQLGVSRPTVREAMIALEISGFVENAFGAGVYVSRSPPLSSPLTDIEQPGPFDLLEARLLIEGETAFLAAQNISSGDVAKLQSSVDDMRLSDGQDFWDLDEAFHVAIANASGNAAMASIVRNFWRQRTRMPMCVRMNERASVEDARDGVIESHDRIIDALKARDSERAKSEISAHLGDFGRALLEKWNGLDDDLRSELSPPAERLVRALS